MTGMTRSITKILEGIEGRADNGPFLITILDQVESEKERLLSALRKAIEELEKHTEATTGYYSGMCTGDSHDAQETLKEIVAILEGGK